MLAFLGSRSKRYSGEKPPTEKTLNWSKYIPKESSCRKKSGETFCSPELSEVEK